MIATATYQAVLSPPAGLGQVSSVPSVPNNTDIPTNSTGVNDNISPPNNTNAFGNPSGIDNPGKQTPAGVQLIMALGTDLFNFFTVNTIAFYASVFTIQLNSHNWAAVFRYTLPIHTLTLDCVLYFSGCDFFIPKYWNFGI